VCIRFFTAIVTEQCNIDPNTHLSVCTSDGHCCTEDERCVSDTANSLQGHCAPNSSEHRWCQARCSNNSDCRAGYECRETGTAGAEPVPTYDMSLGTPAKFCAPTGLSS
jgi:hypothetical protein